MPDRKLDRLMLGTFGFFGVVCVVLLALCAWVFIAIMPLVNDDQWLGPAFCIVIAFAAHSLGADLWRCIGTIRRIVREAKETPRPYGSDFPGTTH